MKTIAFIIPPTVQLLDFAGPVQVFSEAQYLGLNANLEFYAYTETTVSSVGVAFSDVRSIENANLKNGDYLFIPGLAYDYLLAEKNADYSKFADWLKVCHANGVFICSVCNASFILADIGLLNNKKATTHWRTTNEMQKRYPKITVVNDVLFVKDGTITTSAGVSSGIDMALDIVESIKGPLFASNVARGLVLYQRRSHSHNQQSVYLDYRNHINPRIHQLQDYIVENLHQENSLDHLADIAYMSSRNLTRVFKKSTGTTLTEYINKLRAENAKTLLRNPNYTLELVASKCGYKSVRQLHRILQKEYT